MTDVKKVQTLQGVVVKHSSNQTIRVAVKLTKTHPIYRKRYSLLRHYMVHDPENSAQVDDKVTIVSCRPLSKLKHWTLQEK